MADYNSGAALTASETACISSMQTLQRLGCLNQAEPMLTDAAVSYDDITADTSRSDAWKLQRIATRYINEMASLATRLTAAADVASAKYKQDSSAVFGTALLRGDPGTLTMNLRDAQERIKDVNDSIELRRRIDTAVQTDDPTYARAIVARAFAIQDADTVNAFIEAYPASAAPAERLWNAATAGVKPSAPDLGLFWRLGALKPAALSSLQNFEIASAANGQTGVGAWNVSSH